MDSYIFGGDDSEELDNTLDYELDDVIHEIEPSQTIIESRPTEPNIIKHEEKKVNTNSLAYYNSTNYPLSVKAQLESIEYNPDDYPEEQKLLYHQLQSYYYFTKNKNVRGILLNLGMGMGKTRLSTAIVEQIRQSEPRRKIIIILSKSLETNFKKEVHAYSQYKPNESRDPLNHYKFISLNASNMFKQVQNIEKNDQEIAYESSLGSLLDDIGHKNTLDHSLIVIDEAHNFFNSIVNGSKNAVALYDSIMNAKDLRLIFMTGTPIINHPFELVPCYNMLRGYIYYKDESIVKTSKKGKDSLVSLFSEDYDEFENYFIDTEKLTIKNKEKFVNRIYGLTSYYGDLYFKNVNEKPGFPKKLDPIIVKVNMSETQYERYALARSIEQEESKRKFKGAVTRFSAAKGGTSTYRVKSRQISNYCIPEYAFKTRFEGKKKIVEKHIELIKLEDLQNVNKFSPKMEAILNNCEKYKAPGMIYSQFVSGEGLAIFAKILDVNGYVNYSQIEQDTTFDIKQNHKNVYAILSGAIDIEERANIIVEFNRKENTDGSIIKLLLISGAVAEGMDLKRIRHLHIMEPFWNYARVNQVITRAIRYRSHIDLPEDQQNVQVYIYLSDYPKKYGGASEMSEMSKTNGSSEITVREKTTDIDLYEKSIKNMDLINSFTKAIAESSIDCTMHHKKLDPEVAERIKCKLCAPSNDVLFHPVIYKDMMMPSLCKSYSETEVKVNELIDESTGQKYYYSKDGTKIILYYFNKKINGYTKMSQENPYFGKLMSKIYEKMNV